MKNKIIVLALMLVFSLSNMRAQVSLEHSYSYWNNCPLQTINLSNGGYKFIRDVGDTIYIYDINHNLQKTIYIPILNSSVWGNSLGWSGGSNFAVSDNLFNSDNSIEFVHIYRWSLYCSTNNIDSTYAVIMNETGTVLYNLLGISTTNSSMCMSFGGPSNYRVVNLGPNNWKLIGDENFTQNVYSLPGSLPCEACTAMTGVAVNNSPMNYEFQAMPNPASTDCLFTYRLPSSETNVSLVINDMQGREVKRVKLENGSTEYKMNVKDLSEGGYLYFLSGSTIKTPAKKLIIVK